MRETIFQDKKEGEEERNSGSGRIEKEVIEGDIIVESRGEAVGKIKEAFLKRLRERFGPENKNLAYHNFEHSRDMAGMARNILGMIHEEDPDLVSAEDIDLVEMEGWAHDSVQEAFEEGTMIERWRGYEDSDITPSMKARGVTVGNERASANELIAELHRYAHADGSRAFPVDDKNWIKAVSEDIGATTPEIAFGAPLPDGTPALKISSKYLDAKSSLRAVALANADLCAPLANPNPEAFAESGKREYRELNRPGIGREIAGGTEKITPERRIEIASGMIGWMSTQSGLGKHERILVHESLNENERLNASPKSARIKERLMNEVFKISETDDGVFDQNIGAAQKRYEDMEKEYGYFDETHALPAAEVRTRRLERLKSLTLDKFNAIARFMGYDIPGMPPVAA
jgi:hypothetical protein